MANTNGGSLNITAGIDIRQLNKDVQQIKAQLSSVGRAAQNEGAKLDSMAKSVGKSMAAMFTLTAAQQFAQKIFNIRSEFQQLEVAFRVLLKSEEKAITLMSELTQFSATTPYGLTEVSSVTKNLLAYGIAAEDVKETLTTLGNIASAVGAPLKDIAYLYGTTMVQGRMYTQDLRQFMGRGIDLAGKLAEQFGVSTSKVQELVTEGKVGAQEFKRAIDALGGAGGAYDGLMEEQSKTLQGQFSNLQDSVDMMMNEIGKATQDAFGSGIQAANFLVERYKEIGKVLVSVIATVGAYKAALMATVVIQRAMSMAGTVKAFLQLAATIRSATDAQILFNTVCKANPYALVASGLALAGVALYRYMNSAKTATDLTDDLNKSIENVGDAKVNDNLIATYKELSEKQNKSKDETAKLESAVKKLAEQYPSAVTETNKWGEAMDVNIEKIKELNDEYKQIRIDEFNKQLKENEKALEDNKKALARQQALKKAYEQGKREYRDPITGNWLKVYKKQGEEAGKRMLELKDEEKQLTKNITEAKKYISILDGTAKTEEAKQNAQNDKEASAKEKRNSYNRKKRAEKAAEDLKKTKKNLELEIAASEINTMTEGYDKRRAQEALQYRKTLEQIEQEKSEMLKKLQEDEKQQWLSEDENRQEFDFKPTITKLDDDVLAQYEKLGEQAKMAFQKGLEGIQLEEDIEIKAADLEFQSEQDALFLQRRENLRQYYEDYGTYEEKKLAITQKYNKEIAKARDEGDEGRMKSLQRQMEKELDSLGKTYDKSYAAIFEDPSRMTKATIIKTIELARQKLKGMDKDANPEAFKAVQEAINNMQTALDEIDFSGWSMSWDSILKSAILVEKSVKRANEARERGDTEEADNLDKYVARLKENIKKGLPIASANLFASALGRASSAMQEIANVSGDEKIADLAKNLESASNVISSAAQGFASGGPWGMLVGLVSSAAEAIINMAISAEVANAKMQNSVAAFRRELELLNVTIESSEFDSIFGKSSIAEANEALRVAQEAKTLYERASESIKNLSWKYGTGISWFPSEGVLFETYDKIEQLRKADVWREDGMLDVEKAEAFLKTSETITDEAREQVQYVIDLQKAYDNAQKAADEFLASFVGSTASDLTDAIFDAIDNGSDAWDIFEVKGSEAIRALGKQMIKELIIKDLTEQWTDKLRAAAGDPEALAKEYAAMMEWLKGQASTYQQAAQKWEEDYGITAQGERGATAKGIATASQDSVDELNGRATAIQGHTYSIMESSKVTADCMQILRNNSADILRHVQGIHDDTSDMAEDMKEVRASLEDIRDRGVTIKSV